MVVFYKWAYFLRTLNIFENVPHNSEFGELLLRNTADSESPWYSSGHQQWQYRHGLAGASQQTFQQLEHPSQLLQCDRHLALPLTLRRWQCELSAGNSQGRRTRIFGYWSTRVVVCYGKICRRMDNRIRWSARYHAQSEIHEITCKWDREFIPA